MDMLRGILIGLGCFGLLLVGSCTMLGYGTMAVLGKAVEVAEKEQNDPVRKAAREAAVEQAISDMESYRQDRDYNNATDEDYSDFGKPTDDTRTSSY
jgi:hypothetical protein